MVWLHLNAKPFLKLIEDQCRLRFGAEPNPGTLFSVQGQRRNLLAAFFLPCFTSAEKGKEMAIKRTFKPCWWPQSEDIASVLGQR